MVALVHIQLGMPRACGELWEWNAEEIVDPPEESAKNRVQVL